MQYKSSNAQILSCVAKLGVNLQDKEAFAELIGLCLAAGQAGRALALCERALGQWPEDGEFYVMAIQANIALGNYDAAERTCLESMARLDDAQAPYEQYAAISQFKKNYAEAASRWQSVRRKFPAGEAGYLAGFEIAALCKNLGEAGAIALAALKNAPDSLGKMTADASLASQFLAWAKEPLAKLRYSEALRRLDVFGKLFPAKIESQLEKAALYLSMQRPRKAEEACLEGLGLSTDSRLFELLFDSCWLQGKEKEAINFAFVACELAASQADVVTIFVYRLLRGNWLRAAWALYLKHSQLYKPGCALARLKFALRLQGRPRQWRKYLAICVKDYENHVRLKLPLNVDSRFYLNALARLGQSDDAAARRHQVLLESLLLTILPKNSPAKPFFPKKLCYYGDQYSLTYLATVIKKIPRESIDIIICKNRYESKILKTRALDSYNIVDEARLADYEYVITDTLFKFQPGPGQKLICFKHAVDNMEDPPAKCCALILPYETAMLEKPLRLVKAEFKLLTMVAQEQKCELCYTGAYHIEPPLRQDKAALRAELEENYKIRIPADKPLVYIVDGENVHTSHLVYAMNKIVKYAKVIYKPSYVIPKKLMRKIDKEVFILFDGFANNTIRYAADIILAEYFSGTCMSSMMHGLPIIPYYSTTVKHKAPTLADRGPIHFLHYLWFYGLAEYKKYFNFTPKIFMLYQMYQRGFLCNILDAAKMKNSILASSGKYPADLEALQNDAFGRYLRENAAQKTAELILRFVSHGTFGQDCAAFFLNNA